MTTPESTKACSSWTFSLRIPPNIHNGTKNATISPPPEVVQLVARLETETETSVPSLPITTRTGNETKRTLRVASTTSSSSSSSNFDTTETEKLLHQPQPQLQKQPHQSQQSCWSLTASNCGAIGVGATTTTTTTPTEQVQLGLESNYLLQLVYRPAWQGLPEYTQRSSKLMSLLTSCCNGNQDYRIPGPQQVSDLYTTQDIVHYEVVDDPKQPFLIRGIGPCQALRVYLRPRYYYSNDEDGHNILNSAGTDNTRLPPMPDYFQDAMKAHFDRMGLSSRSTSLTEASSTWSRFSEPRDSLHPSKSDDGPNDDDRTGRLRQCIVITFAMPLLTSTEAKDSTTGSSSPSAPPPLLWKVDLPPPLSRNDSLIVDSITVLDGKLQQPSSSKPPTHVYINGYQSWSFAGSVTKGERQPQSAMPNMFSGAFNRGGTPPLEKATTQWFGRREHDNTTTTTESSSTYYQSNFFTCITTEGKDNEQKCDDNGPMLTSSNASNNAEEIGLDENGGRSFWAGCHNTSNLESFALVRI
jgi:hypothetical protein